MDIGRELNQINKRLSKIERSPRLTHASIENTAIQVYDGQGSLRGVIGQQADGTTGVNITNGPPPPQPSAPIVASVLGGVTVSWDGTFADGSVLPLDWARVEVHASILASYTPVPATLQGTIETAQGATVVVPCDAPVYVRLLARNTSGTASTPSVTVGPLGPTPVVADDILDGIVTTVKLADDAVTAAKLAAGAVDTTALQDGAVLAAKLADAAVEVGKLANNAVTGPAIASGAVTAGKLAANSVVAGNIQAGAVTSATIAAGAVTTDKLTVTGGANLLSDPSFEGAYTAALVTGNSFWSVDATKGNGSTKSLKVNATAGTPTNRDLTLFDIPILPGEQLYLAVDYQASTDYVGTPRIYARWEDASGTFLASGAAQASPPTVGATWQRITATVTAPANTARVKLNVASTSGTAGTLWFDNAAVRPVAGGTQIQDGAITTQKIVAGAVQTVQLDTGAVNAGKIASGAVTTDKLDALAVTADKIAANAITVGKIQAGAVDATALAADAITGKTITGGTITGTTITGGTLQTATSGEHITLNELGQNKIILYDSSNTAINELSARGLLVKGSSGAVLWLNPNLSYPQLQLHNAGGTNKATVQVTESNPGDADLEQFCGPFSGSSYSDMVWRNLLTNDSAVIERLRFSDPDNVRIGARLRLTETQAWIGLNRTDDTTKVTTIVVEANLATLAQGRFAVDAPASTFSALYANAATGHTGNLLRLQLASVDKFLVDKDGNATVKGILTAGNIATGTVTITPSAANTPTSASVSFPALAGTTFRGYATANTTVPGVRTPTGPNNFGVTGVSVSSVTSSTALIWVNRENTTATSINWMVIGS
ncbi:hypothetical protein [Streptomyces sp. NPDC048521]|uniref:hypothetical protein n=1 Tax=Streptomyces sp. NPDC048521 TaxID=3365566 RepID=UPI003715A560